MSKQHTKPCAECPFNRKTAPGYLGGSDPETYVGQAYGPFWLPCHSTHDYMSLEARLDQQNLQCAGAAIHRANIGRSDLMPPQLLHLPADSAAVFATQAEFLAHHKGISAEQAASELEELTPLDHMGREMVLAQERALHGTAFVTKVKRREQANE